MPSYRKINYSLRPAKFAERKMLCELFSRLRAFGALEAYRYVGFGSIWFSDCILFHKSLGVTDIISIEKVMANEDRFRFNLPYQNIRLEMQNAADVLPNLDWHHRMIIWLDYDAPLDLAILDDIRTCGSRIQSGSALAITVQSEKLYDKRDLHEEPLHIEDPEQFTDYFGSARTFRNMDESDLRGWGISKTSRRVLRSEIQNALSAVNLARPPGSRISFKQIAAFEYNDGAKMTTVVGVFVDQGQNGHFAQCGFDELFYYRDGDDAFRIIVPLLTPREMRHLDKSLPLSAGTTVNHGSIPEGDAKNYAKLYRYLPNFAAFEP